MYLEYARFCFVDESDPEVLESEYPPRLPIGYAIHWIEDKQDPSVNDTYEFVAPSPGEITARISEFSVDDNGDFAADCVAGIQEDISGLDGQGARLSDYTRYFVNSFRFDEPIETVVYDGMHECAGGEDAHAKFVDELLSRLAE